MLFLLNTIYYTTSILMVRQQAGTEELEVIRRYSTLFGELVIILRSISQQWENYIDEIQSQWSRNSYQVPLVISTSPGRPRFDISQEQLVYLHSLSFSWS